MISKLFIKNYALIDYLSLDFSKGFTAITGETGAGKSIILGAMGLALGKRADSGILKDESTKCIIEIQVDISLFNLKEQFSTLDLDYENITILRREIQPSGKSRAFINDTPVKLSELQNIGSQLIDIHSQHDTLLLNNEKYQLRILDSLSKNKKERQKYLENYNVLKALNQELNKLLAKNNNTEDVDYLRFLTEEIESANLEANEEIALEEELNSLEHADEINTVLYNGFKSLSQEEVNILADLRVLENGLENIAKYQNAYKELLERVSATKIELEDIAFEMENAANSVESNPGRLEKIKERYDILQHLILKHKVEDTAALIEKKNNLDDELYEIENRERVIAQQKNKITVATEAVQKAAKKLSATRQKVIPKIEKDVLSILDKLNFKGATFQLVLKTKENFSESGTDQLEFMFSANPGMPIKPLNKVASGGELSRLMLSLKSVLAHADGLPTIVFDEIDTGVSGETAQRMSFIIKEMSKTMQVLAITHLPQIAAAGDHHYVVEKNIENNQTETNLRAISGEERVEVIAKMLSHSNPTKAARENARDLIAVS